jgi:hypothetical protein
MTDKGEPKEGLRKYFGGNLSHSVLQNFQQSESTKRLQESQKQYKY